MSADDSERFTLDRFQVEAIEAIDAGQSVLVAAPTGSGKTVVAEHAVAVPWRRAGEAFYTTPIKALSNQKYGDLLRRHGAGRVGLLTGDNAINGDAPIVVMTTEVLRNMIYAGRPRSTDLALRRARRGPLPAGRLPRAGVGGGDHPPAAEVTLVCLSATVSNADELRRWISDGPRADGHGRSSTSAPSSWSTSTSSPTANRPTFCCSRRWSTGGPTRKATGSTRRPPRATHGATSAGGRRRRYATPRRLEVVDRLVDEDLLPGDLLHLQPRRVRRRSPVPARVGCPADHAPTSAPRSARIAERHVEHLGDADLDVLDYDRFAAGLEAGVAPHHAGMVPPFKEAVEACFAEGLGQGRVRDRDPRARHQHAGPLRRDREPQQVHRRTARGPHARPVHPAHGPGRAPGIDPVGHAIVLWSPFVPFDRVAALAASRRLPADVVRSDPPTTWPPTSSSVTRPTMHIACSTSPSPSTRRTGRWSASRPAGRRRSPRSELVEADARCELGDIEEYRALLRPMNTPVRPARHGVRSTRR